MKRSSMQQVGWRWSALAAAAFISFAALAAEAAAPRVLPEGKQPSDARLAPPKDLDGYFPFDPPKSKEAWDRRSEQVRRRLQVALGVWPLPTKTDLNAVVHSPIEKNDYIVERAYFESMPGFYVTGSLYRPKEGKGPFPAVLCPHGHWANGRFHDAGAGAVKSEIDKGAEMAEDAAHSPLQARCVHLARLGCVVFHYDMIGYADSTQISFEVAHRFAKQRPEMNAAENWGLFSPQAESNLQSVMGLQTVNSIRALDFVTSLPYVDAKRIGVTGASGGGTQTFILCAIDPRPTVSVPAVMVSTAMQGGCTCENASLLRIGTGNVEIAGLFAPKPQGLTAADDWTKEMETKGFPQLRELYTMLGAGDQVTLWANIQFGHNYNYVSRVAMYGWMNEHLKLGRKGPFEESPFDRLSTEEMTVWTDSHPRPAGGDEFERKLLHWWTLDSQKQMQSLVPRDAGSLKKFREVVGSAVDVVIDRDFPEAGDVQHEHLGKEERDGYAAAKLLIRNRKHQEELPAIVLHPSDWKGQAVLWVHERGKAGLYREDGSLDASVQKLLDSGAAVVGVDLIDQGEFLTGSDPAEQTRRVANTREAAAYTLGYNSSLFAQRVHDVLTAAAFMKHHQLKPKSVDVVGLGKAGPWVAAARAQAGDAIDRAVVDTGGFRFGAVNDIRSPDLLPGGAKYFDLPGMLALGAPGKLWLAGESDKAPEVAQAAYAAAGAEKQLSVYSGAPEQAAEKAVAWLLGAAP
jgi:dienelactone hydrolase